jgi:hypothetical protein
VAWKRWQTGINARFSDLKANQNEVDRLMDHGYFGSEDQLAVKISEILEQNLKMSVSLTVNLHLLKAYIEQKHLR